MVRQWIANPLSPVRIWVPPYTIKTITLFFISTIIIIYGRIILMIIEIKRECGEIGRHDGLKIRCLVIGVRVQVSPFPI